MLKTIMRNPIALNPIALKTNLCEWALVGLCALSVVGCTAPSTVPSMPDTAAAPTPAETAPRSAPIRAPPPAGETAPSVSIDRNCQVDADCTVKDVGNCCGAMPACVNKDSRTDPAAVQAECARNGMSSVCGFKDISACTCSNRQCVSENESGAVTR